ncbi:MAG: rhodanese-like domain-containing protein, partial [Actinobacteria bacterium]|nr:rhodanese-like domain-containing protein [Actinomycetota bacterium]
LDVREPGEWALGVLEGSVLMSIGEVVDRVGEIPRDRPILCVCRSGSRSDQVARYLEAQGFEGVANLRGGLKALGMQS